MKDGRKEGNLLQGLEEADRHMHKNAPRHRPRGFHRVDKEGDRDATDKRLNREEYLTSEKQFGI